MSPGLIGIDVGGTFTDCVSFKDGAVAALKVPTTTAHEERGVREGAAKLGLSDVVSFNHASTVGLNALITRRIPKVAYLGTEGHRDIPDMGRAIRPFEHLTDPTWHRPFSDSERPLVPRYLRRGIRERILADGSVLTPLDLEQARRELEVLKKCDVQGVAICLINAYVNPTHEVALRELVWEVLGSEILCSISSEVSPVAKEYPRSSTTIIDVLMKGVFATYTDNLVEGLRDEGLRGDLNFADCTASLVPVADVMERPYRVIFSGPAAGTSSSAYFGRLIGAENLVCADVGGTSTDLSLVKAGSPLVNTMFEVEHDLVVNTLANEVVSIGAGGGSIVSVGEAGQIRAGPESAGAEPGPACYGRGGTHPTVTDACLLMGLLSDEEFLGGQIKLDPSKSREAFEMLDTPLGLDERVHHAYWLAVNHISEGITNVCTKYGVDPRDYSVMAYGSAGPMLVPPALELANVASVVIPPYPGLFSALGLLSADHKYTDQRSEYLFLEPGSAERLDAIFSELEQSLLAQLSFEPPEIELIRTLDGRLVGQTWETPFVPVPSGEITPTQMDEIVSNFHDTYEQRWGNRLDGMPVQGVTYRVQLVVPATKVEYEGIESAKASPSAKSRVALRYLAESEVEIPIYGREGLRAGAVVEGPAIIREPTSTSHIGADHRATIGDFGEIVITLANGRE
jgi:N-methylhydantoinase A